MGLNTTTNLYFKIIANTLNVDITASSKDVEQKYKSLSHANTTDRFREVLTAMGVTVPGDDGFVTKTNPSSITSVTTNIGDVAEKTEFSISAIVPYNVRTCVGSLTIAAKSSKRIDRAISLKLRPEGVLYNVVVDLEETSNTTTNSNVTTRVFDIYCKSTHAVLSTDPIFYDLNISTDTLTTRSIQIENIFFGSRGENFNISPAGEERQITIYGAPGTRFKKTILDANDKPIISRSDRYNSINAYDTTINIGSGKSVIAIEGKIPENGVYKYTQKFPRAPIVCTTAVNVGGGVSNATQVTFDSLVGVSVGDRLFSNFVEAYKAVKVVSIDSEFVCTLSRPITAADDAAVTFRSGTSYKYLITSSDGLGPNIPTTYPNYTFNQYLNPTLTLKAKTSVATFTINGGGAGVDHEQYYDGIANLNSVEIRRKTKLTRTFTLSYVIIGHGGKTISLVKTPVFDTDGGNTVSTSDWTNTDSKLNGGTAISISGISAVLSDSGGVTNAKCTITATVVIEKWGTEDVVMELDLDSILTASTP